MLITNYWMVEACMRVDPVMAMGPVDREIFVMPALENTGWILSKVESTSSGLL